jgi:hypothetical protein
MSDTSAKAKLGRILKKMIRYINQNPEIIKNSLLMLKELEKPYPKHLALNEKLKPYDTLGILE